MRPYFKIIIATLLVSCALGLYALTVRGVDHNIEVSEIKNNLDQGTKPLELSPERGRFVLTMSLVKNHSFALSEAMANAVYPDVGWYQGKFFILFAPGISLMAAPLYILGSHFNLSQVFAFYLSSLFATANGVIIFVISRRMFRLPVWASLFASLAFCFGSTSWAYAVTLYQHHATTFFMLSGLYAVWKYRQGGKWSWMYAAYTWLMYALAIGIDYPNILTFFPLIVYLGLSSLSISETQKNYRFSIRPALFLTAVVFIFISLVHGYYNKVHFGGWTKLSGGLIDYKKIVDNKLLDSSAGEQKIRDIESKINPSKYFSEEDFPTGIYTLIASDERGFIFYAPLFALGVLGIFTYIKKLNLEVAAMVATMCSLIFLYSSWSDPWGGWAFGPRYLIPVFGLLSPFVGVWITTSAKRFAAFLLFIYSSAIALLGTLTTNGVPPALDAKLINVPHTYLYNFQFLFANKSSSFIFNYFVKNFLNLTQYYVIILTTVSLIAFILLFIMPGKKNDN